MHTIHVLVWWSKKCVGGFVSNVFSKMLYFSWCVAIGKKVGMAKPMNAILYRTPTLSLGHILPLAFRTPTLSLGHILPLAFRTPTLEMHPPFRIPTLPLGHHFSLFKYAGSWSKYQNLKYKNVPALLVCTMGYEGVCP